MGWPGWEPCWALARSHLSGLPDAMSEGQIEMMTRKTMIRAEAMKTGLRRRSRQASAHRLPARSLGAPPSGPSGVPSRVVPSLMARSAAPPAPVPAIAFWGSG